MKFVDQDGSNGMRGERRRPVILLLREDDVGLRDIDVLLSRTKKIYPDLRPALAPMLADLRESSPFFASAAS